MPFFIDIIFFDTMYKGNVSYWIVLFVFVVVAIMTFAIIKLVYNKG